MNFWYGGVRVNDIFTWSDQTPFRTTFWSHGNGLLREEKCLHMHVHVINDHTHMAGRYNGWRNELDCSNELGYVCKLGRGE